MSTVIHYDPRFMEEALFHAQRQARAATAYNKERDALYEFGDADERNRRFAQLNRSWFRRLQLDRPVSHAITEQPLIDDGIPNCYVAAAALGTEAGAELFVAAQDNARNVRRTLRILLRPEALLDAPMLTPFLRYELLHIADMLDPGFAYQPTLPESESGPVYDGLLTQRYRLLWNITIHGRMARRGWCEETIRERNMQDFRNAFPMLGRAEGEIFESFFKNLNPRHADLVAFAQNPHTTRIHDTRRTALTHCSLCRFPSHAFEPAPENLGGETIEAIKEDFPSWRPDNGLCVQCADLYRARKLSAGAAEALPGSNSCVKPGSPCAL